MKKYGYILNTATIVLISAAALLLAASAACAQGLPSGGSGEVSLNPVRVKTGTVNSFSFGISHPGPDQIYEVQIKIPYNFKFTPSVDNVRLEGNGALLARVDKISGGGFQNGEYVVRIIGLAVGAGQSANLTLMNVTAPQYVASNQSQLNRFGFKTRTAQGVLAEISKQLIAETYNPSAYTPVFLINEIAPENSGSGDFIEIYCKNDGNYGNGVDILNYTVSRMESATADKTFGSMIVKSGNYLLLRYNSSQADDAFPSLNLLNSYTAVAGLPETGFMAVMKNSAGDYVDAVVLTDMTDNYDYDNIGILNLKGQWLGTDKKAGVDIRTLEANYVVARFPNKSDTNTKADFSIMNYQTPGATNGNLGVPVKILVNEFKPSSDNGDFLEFYVSDDGMGGGGVDLAGYRIGDGVDFGLTFPAGTTVYSGDYIVVYYNSSSNTVGPRSGKTLPVYTTVTGLSRIFGALTVTNSALAVLDAVCYCDGPLTEANRLVLKKYVDSGDILDMNPALVYDEADCVSIKNMPSNSSFGRNDKNVDTNSQTDFTNFAKPTPAKANIASGLPLCLATDPEGTVYANANSEVKVVIKAMDVDNALSTTSSNMIEVTSDAEGTTFSEDGINYSKKIEVTLRYGSKKIYIKDPQPSSKIITFRDKFDDRLKYKLNFVVTGLSPVQINEILYNPPATVVRNPSDLQWIELYNSGSSLCDISGYKLKCGSAVYVFPNGTKIESKSYIVVTSRLVKATYREEPAFADVYGDADGYWNSKDGFTALDSGTFRFSTSGGRLVLLSADDVELSVVEYSSVSGAKGNGKSLEKSIQSVYSIGNFDVDRYNFTESGQEMGTPGKINSKNAYSSAAISLYHSPLAEAVVNLPIEIFARSEGADDIEVGYRNSAVAGVYTYIPMKRIENTNVYRTVIPHTAVTLEGVDYYIRAFNDTKEYLYSPEEGDTKPHKIKVVDNAPKLRLATPVKSVAPSESFYVDVNIENAAKLSGVSFDLTFNPAYFSVEDQDAVRPGTQIAVGSVFAKFYNEVNSVNQQTGTISFTVVDETGSGAAAGQVARIKFKAASTFGTTYPEYGALEFKNVTVSGSPDVNIFNDRIKLGDRATAVVGISGGIVGGENQARLVIPAGAVKTDTAFTIKKLIKSEMPKTNAIDNMNGIHSLDVGYELEPHGFQFQKPVTLELPFTAADISANRVTDQKYLKIYFYDTSKLAYEKIGGIVSTGKVSVKINHLSVYILVEDQSKEEFDLSDVFVSPNPFSPNGNGWSDSTFINYKTTVDSAVTIKIFDVRGVLTRKLMNGENVSGGRNKAEWDGRDDFGRIVRTGVYVFQLKSVSPGRSTKTHQGTIVVSRNLKD